MYRTLIIATLMLAPVGLAISTSTLAEEIEGTTVEAPCELGSYEVDDRTSAVQIKNILIECGDEQRKTPCPYLTILPDPLDATPYPGTYWYCSKNLGTGPYLVRVPQL